MSIPGNYSWLETLPIILDFQFKMTVCSFEPDPYLVGFRVAGDIGEGLIEDTEEVIAGSRGDFGIPESETQLTRDAGGLGEALSFGVHGFRHTGRDCAQIINS